MSKNKSKKIGIKFPVIYHHESVRKILNEMVKRGQISEEEAVDIYKKWKEEKKKAISL